MALSIALAALPLLAAACVVDVRRRLIPDWTAAGAAGVGAVAATVAGAPLEALAAGLACLALGSAASWSGVWGWGDAKLLGGTAVVAGSDGVLPLLLFTALIGAGLAAALLLVRPLARTRWLPVSRHLPRWVHAELRRLRCAPSVPYALAIGGGLAAALLTGSRV